MFSALDVVVAVALVAEGAMFLENVVQDQDPAIVSNVKRFRILVTFARGSSYISRVHSTL